MRLVAFALAFIVIGQAATFSISRNAGDYFVLLAAILFGLSAARISIKVFKKGIMVQLFSSAAISLLATYLFWFFYIWLRRDVFELMHPLNAGPLVGVYGLVVSVHAILWGLAATSLLASLRARK